MKKKLQQIAEHLERINRDRQAKHLEGEAAIKHYNEWMAASGMEHLMTK